MIQFSASIIHGKYIAWVEATKASTLLEVISQYVNRNGDTLQYNRI